MSWVLEQNVRGVWVVISRFHDKAAAELALRRVVPKAALANWRVREKPVA